MNFFALKGRTLLLAAAMTAFMFGCGGDGGSGGVVDGGGGGTAPGTAPDVGGSSITGGANCTSAATCGSGEMPDGKTWMTENLNILTAGSWCYGDRPDNCEKYGRMYTWAAAKTACQSIGMRLPTREEWGALAIAAGGTGYNGTGTDGTSAKALKSASGWFVDKGTDDYGFSALPGGNYRFIDGEFKYESAGFRCYMWTATEDGSENAYVIGMNYVADYVSISHSEKNLRTSVRCIAN
ncbi:hypothetical protein R80B4_01715 [Fibrobacteres bacterium R8-0-B4]